jgi:hypothetical protein
MALTQTTLRSTLAQILSINPKYIVPKQGSWFNPQDVAIGADKPDTWVAFNIDIGQPRNIPMLMETDTIPVTLSAVTWYVGSVEIQFVGTRAEELAQTVPQWLIRSDVKTAFGAIDAELMADNTAYKVATYYQDGLNTQLAFRVTIKVFHSSAIPTAQVPWTGTDPVAIFKQGGY